MKDIQTPTNKWQIRIGEIQNITDLVKLQKQFEEEDKSHFSPYEIPLILNAFDNRRIELAKK